VKISSDNLASSLTRDLKPIYLVSGDEPLLAGEAADAIRARARAAGFTERELHFAERGFDWSELRASSQTLSLFAEKRIIEVRLPGSPGDDGSEWIVQVAEQAAGDQLILIITGKLDGRTQNSKWVSAIDRAGVFVQVWPIDTARLPGWIRERLGRKGFTADAAAVSMLADRVEGNLLAAHQEIEKLALILPPGEVSAEAILNAVSMSARFDVLQLGEASMRGQGARALRILEGLRAEGVEPTLVLWAVNKDLQWIAKSLHHMRSGMTAEAAMNAEYVWRPRQAAMKQALARLKSGQVRGLLVDAGRVDRSIKGVLRSDAWAELEALVARFAGTKLARAA
jgi:DNA polymerase-3 subunit delta